MSAEEVRSPDLIRNYFDLLNQRKRGNKVDLLPIEISANKQLQSMQQAMELIKTAISNKKSAILSDQSELLSIEQRISSVEQNTGLFHSK